MRGLEAHPPDEWLPLSRAPRVYMDTLVTHLPGCSMGQRRWRRVLSGGQGTHHGCTIMVATVNCCYYLLLSLSTSAALSCVWRGQACLSAGLHGLRAHG